MLILCAAPADATPTDVASCAGQETGLAQRFESEALFDEAAAAYAGYARACAGAADAPSQLARAVELRFALGEWDLAEQDVTFFVQRFGAHPSDDLDRVLFARAKHARAAGDVRSVLTTLHDADRITPARHFERALMLLEAKSAQGTRAGESEVRRLLEDWNRSHAGIGDDWMALSVNERDLIGRLGKVAFDALCQQKDPDLSLPHPSPGTMNARQYDPFLIHWLKRRTAALSKRVACYEAGLGSIKPLPPAPELARWMVAIVGMYADLKAELMRVHRHKQFQRPPGPSMMWDDGFIPFYRAYNSEMERALYRCSVVCFREGYSGEARTECDRALNRMHPHGLLREEFDVIEMIPPLRAATDAVPRPAPAAAPPSD